MTRPDKKKLIEKIDKQLEVAINGAKRAAIAANEAGDREGVDDCQNLRRTAEELQKKFERKTR